MGKDGFYFKMGWIILLFSGFVSCNSTGKKIDQGAESFKIYRLLIDQFYIEKENQPVVINQNSSRPPLYDTRINLIFFSPKIDKDTLNNFEKVYQTESEITTDFPGDSKYIFMAINKGQTYSNYMKRLNKLYSNSGGLITFSKIGFNKKIDQALVGFLINRWAREQTSGIVILEKKKGPFPHVWSIVETKIDNFSY
jgi:hypothetical protein